MSQVLIYFLGASGLVCLLAYLWQMQSALLPKSQKARLARAILSGFLINVGLTLLKLFITHLNNPSPISIRELGLDQAVFFPVQVLATGITYGIYLIKARVNDHLQSFENRYGEQRSNDKQ